MLGIFLDLSKAFDTLDHDILIYKLQLYGIRGVVFDLFKNYLQNRRQYVVINGFKSESKLLRCGVPQGSILGPLLFLFILMICAIIHLTVLDIYYLQMIQAFYVSQRPKYITISIQ